MGKFQLNLKRNFLVLFPPPPTLVQKRNSLNAEINFQINRRKTSLGNNIVIIVAADVVVEVLYDHIFYLIKTP